MLDRKLNILIVDDHALFREGLRVLLSKSFKNAEIYLAQDGQEGVEVNARVELDLVLTDIDMPRMDGFEFVKKIRQSDKSPKILVISMYQGAKYIDGMLKAEADGYLLKDTPPDELVTAIEEVLSGGTYIAFKITQNLTVPGDEPQPLTPREKEVLAKIASGETSKEIANNLGLSHRTVESHRAKIMLKLKVDNLAGLIRYAIEHNIQPNSKPA